MAVIDMTNQKFNHWTVIERAPNSPRGDAMWLCECDCEAHTRQVVKGGALRSGHSKSCGCIKKEIAKQIGHKNSLQLIGRKFNHLLVLEKAYSYNYKIYWKCQCDCIEQNIVYVPSDKLISGHTSSCGCATWNNLLNKQFGKLKVIEKTNERTTNGEIIWKCECNCTSKNIIKVCAKDLIKRTKFHCGCLGPGSAGEMKIKQLLEDNNINFQREKTFLNCINPETGQRLRFDFYIDNKYLIEYDGEQHFYTREKGFFNKEATEDLQKRDEIKNQWCKINNIPLIRIPFYHYENLIIDDLILEKSDFVYN